MRTLCVLLWKDLMRAKRQKLSLFYQMVYPLIFTLLVIFYDFFNPEKYAGLGKPKVEKLVDYTTTPPRCILYSPNSRLAGPLMDEVGRQLGLPRLTAMPRKSPCNGYYPYSNYSEIAALVKTFKKNEALKHIIFELPHFRRDDDAPSDEELLVKAMTLRMVHGLIYFFVLALSTINLFTQIMTRMLSERANGIQELIKMNGVSPTTMGIAYFINSIPPALSLSIGCAILVKVGKSPIIQYTSGTYIFVGLALYAVSILAFGMVCSYVMNKSRFGTLIGIFIFIATLAVVKNVWKVPRKSIFRILSGMLWHVPISWMCLEIFMFDAIKKPLTISDLNSKLNTRGSVLEAYICLILQSLMYFAVAWYLSHVRQGKYGNSLPWNFLCKKKVRDSANIDAYSKPHPERDNRYFEEPPQGMPVGIKITNVSKFYLKPALSDVSLDVYKGEITVLLGHNGAGKTTLMNIITGMTHASRGKVLVNGLETTSESLQVRRRIGLCTQHNLFIDYVNVIEHVMFFNMLKGNYKDPRAHSKKLLNTLGIDQKASADPSELSGGMQRRLQLACSLAGDSDVLVLDEPTSGLDVETRRELWNLLLSLRGERTVFLSTHFMEEADALGDRVAALHSGYLRCYATPMFLKKAMGGGYRLSLVTSGKPKEAEITAMVTEHVGGATVRDESINTITYSLPSTGAPQFPALFTALETNRSALEINSIGVGVSTMEDVFLFLCNDSVAVKEESDTEVAASEYGKIKGMALYKRQAIVLFKRHYNFLSENLITFPILHIIVPALLIYVLICNSTEETPKPQPKTELNVLRNRNIYKPLSDRMAPYSTVYRHAATDAVKRFRNSIEPQLLALGDKMDKSQAPPDNGVKGSLDCSFYGPFIGCVILFTSYNLQALPAREGASGARHLHVMAGCPAALHWLCTFAFHNAVTLLTVVPITIICTYVGDADNTFRNAHFLLTLVLILILGNMSSFGFGYLLSLFFDYKMYSSVTVGCIIWSAFIALSKTFSYVMQIPQPPQDLFFVYLSYVLPPFHMMVSMSQAAYVARLNALCELHKNRCPAMLLEDKGFDEKKCCAGESTAYVSFEEYAPGAHILILVVQGIVCMTLVILVQLGLVSCFFDRLLNKKFKPQPLSHLDELVAAEATLVDREIELPEQELVKQNKAMLVSHLHKNYADVCSDHHAVKGISFSVKKGECFGLLGLNGAGKSTTFKMMTSETCPTSGRIFSNGVFLHKQKKEFLRKIGYCPQFLGIDDFQTGKDNLRMVLTIRGLDDKDIDKEIKTWIAVVGLEKYANMRVSSYSGGYQRRLAAAVALCSGAPLSLLDEPTAGVDVGARRLVHAALRKALRKGDSIIITSHSMDEMESLCSRIAIMEAGKIRALGSSAELRTKYAQGYTLMLKVKGSHDGHSGGKSAVDDVKDAVAAQFNCVLIDEHTTMLHYHIKDKMHYSVIFSKLEDLRKQYPNVIEDYSVSETTLEQVFLHLAKEHLEAEAAEAAASKQKETKKNKKKPSSTV